MAVQCDLKVSVSDDLKTQDETGWPSAAEEGLEGRFDILRQKNCRQTFYRFTSTIVLARSADYMGTELFLRDSL